jgi:hypothetical protein
MAPSSKSPSTFAGQAPRVKVQKVRRNLQNLSELLDQRVLGRAAAIMFQVVEVSRPRGHLSAKGGTRPAFWVRQAVLRAAIMARPNGFIILFLLLPKFILRAPIGQTFAETGG